MNLEDKIRVIPVQTYEPELIAALDKVLLELVETKNSPPTLIFYNWENSISISRGQSLDDFDLDKVKQYGYKLVRMESGGDAVFHHTDQDFSYSLIVPKQYLNLKNPDNPVQVYSYLCGKIVTMLQSYGINAELKNKSGIYVNNSKVCGNASRLDKSTLMLQGIFLHKKPSDQTVQNMLDIMTQYSEKDYFELRKLLSGLDQYIPNIDPQDLMSSLATTFSDNYYIGKLTKKESIIAKTLTNNSDNLTYNNNHKTLRGLCWLPRRSV